MSSVVKTDSAKFSTSALTGIVQKSGRVKTYFQLLNKIEMRIMEDPTIVHKSVIVELDDGTLYKVNYSTFYINLILWLFNINYSEKIISEDLHDLTSATKGNFISTMDKIISKFMKLGYNLNSVNIVGTVKERIIKIARFYGDVVSNTFSLYDVMAFESRNPKFAELFNTQLNLETMSISEIEKFLDFATKRLYNLIIEDRRSNLYPFISTGIVKELQMSQMFIAVGGRYDIDKTILPRLIEKGWMHGMQTVSEFFAEAVSTRNSIIVKKDAVPDSGYISRKVNIACLNTILDSNIFDCGTKHYLNLYVEDYDYLKLIEGKYMVMSSDGSKLREITTDDKHLIGTTIQIRSHTKCITGHKLRKVCCTCFGNKHVPLSDARVGGLVSIKLINPVTQLGLSAKHASKTKSEEIVGDIIERYFTESNSNIYPRKDICSRKDVVLLIPMDIANDILSSDNVIDNGSVEEGLNFSKEIEMIYVVENGNLRGMDLDDKGFFVNISDNLISLISDKRGTIVRTEDVVNSIVNIETMNDTANWDLELQDQEFFAINFNDMEPAESVFNVKLLTEEVSKYLRMIKATIDGIKTPTYTKAEEMIYDIYDVLHKAEIKSHGMFIHMETLVMNLTRVIDDVITKPDYSTLIEPEIQFVKLTQAIQRSDFLSGVVFQDLRRQFEVADTLKKNTPGIFDIFFKNKEFLKNGEEFARTRPYLKRNYKLEDQSLIVNKKRKK